MRNVVDVFLDDDHGSRTNNAAQIKEAGEMHYRLGKDSIHGP